MKTKRNSFLRIFAVLLTVLMLCTQLLPAGAAGEDEERDMMLSLYYALEAAYGISGDLLSSYGGPETYSFDGTLTENNIDRIAGAAFSIDCGLHPEKYENIDIESDSLSGDLLRSAILACFDVNSADLSLSKHYDKTSNTYHVANADVFFFPFFMLSSQLSFQYETLESGMLTLDGVYMGTDRYATGRLVFEVMVTDSGLKIYSVNLSPTELLTLKSTSSLEIENYTHYLKGLRADTNIGALTEHFATDTNNIEIVSFYYGETSFDALAGTGSSVFLLDEFGDVVDYLELVVLGDVNGDGTLSSADYMQIRKAFAGEFYLEGSGFEAADTNKDGELGTADYMRLRKHFMQEFDIYA